MHEAQFAAVGTSALSARRFVADAVVDVPREISETIALIASELAANSVRHAASAFEIRVEQLPDRVHIEVEDDGDGQPVVKSPGLSDTSGRGLQIVQALADAWGVIPKQESPGKTVWATIALRTADDSARRSQGAQNDAGEHQKRTGPGTGSSGSRTSLGAVGKDVDPLGVGPRLCTRTWRSRRGPRPRPRHRQGALLRRTPSRSAHRQ